VSASTRPRQLPHPRVTALSDILERLNIWACAPTDKHRSTALKAALAKYRKAVEARQYPPLSANCCTRTAASKETPQPIEGSFEYYFGRDGQAGAV